MKLKVELAAESVSPVVVAQFQEVPAAVSVIVLVPNVRERVSPLLDDNPPHEQAWLFVLRAP